MFVSTANAANAFYFSNNSPSIQPGTLISLLIESVLDGMFFAPAAPGVNSPWMHAAPSLGTKQSGATFVVAGDWNNGTMEVVIPRQIDALVNMGVVFTLPALAAAGTTGANLTTYVPSGDNVNGTAISNTSLGEALTLAASYGTTLPNNTVAIHRSIEKQGIVAPTANLSAYRQFAQYAIIESIKVTLNSSHIVEMTGEDLLVLHDIYGCGIHGLDVLENAFFNTNDIIERRIHSIAASVHIISLSLWWCSHGQVSHPQAGQAFKNAFLPSSVAYSPLSVSVTFGTPVSVAGCPTATSEGTFETNHNNMHPRFIFDGYFMTSAEKEIIQKTSGHQPYRKINKTTIVGSNENQTQNLNFNFVGADIIAFAECTATGHAAAGKFGQCGKNDSERPYLKSVTYSLNHNNMAVCDHATTKWAMINGNTHMPRLGALYFSAAPGSDIQAVMANKPFATIPFSRAENTSLTFALSENRQNSITAANLRVTVLTNVYSALARSTGTINVLYN